MLRRSLQRRLVHPERLLRLAPFCVALRKVEIESGLLRTRLFDRARKARNAFLEIGAVHDLRRRQV